jgi:beta-lactamase class A
MKKILLTRGISMKKNYILIVSLIGIFLLGVIGMNFFNKESSEFLIESEVYSDINYKDEDYIEVVETTSYDREIEEIIKRYAQGYEDNLSLYYYNFETKDEYSYNGDEYYVAASTTKIPLAMSVADDVYNGEYSMDTEIKYSYDDYEEGTGILWQEDYIAPITVDDAIYLSIVYSDNIAKNMLRRISTISTNDYISNITGNVSLINDENKYTANQLGEVLKKLYLNEEKNPYYDNILEYMSETVFHDRIDKYLPYYNVAHKIGTYYRYYHDIGIIYAKEEYVLVIMTKDMGELDEGNYKDEDERLILDGGELASEIMASISREIYNLIEN